MAHYDDKDPACLPPKHRQLMPASTPPNTNGPIRIGVPKELLVSEWLETPESQTFFDYLTRLEESGAQIKMVSLPHARYALAAYYIIASAEASSNLARYDGVRYGSI